MAPVQGWDKVNSLKNLKFCYPPENDQNPTTNEALWSAEWKTFSSETDISFPQTPLCCFLLFFLLCCWCSALLPWFQDTINDCKLYGKELNFAQAIHSYLLWLLPSSIKTFVFNFVALLQIDFRISLWPISTSTWMIVELLSGQDEYFE